MTVKVKTKCETYKYTCKHTIVQKPQSPGFSVPIHVCESSYILVGQSVIESLHNKLFWAHPHFTLITLTIKVAKCLLIQSWPLWLTPSPRDPSSPLQIDP